MTLTNGVDVEVAVLSLRARAGGASGGIGVITPVCVRRVSATSQERHPIRDPRAKLAAALTRRIRQDHTEDDMNGKDAMGSESSRADAIASALRDAARGEVAAGPVTVGDRTVIPLAETFFAGGFGGGFGESPEQAQSPGSGGGAGGGGFGRSRTVAVVIAGPEGVEVRPIVDTTAITLAGIAALLGLLNVARRRRRR